MTTGVAIELRNLTKRYGGAAAVDGLSLRVAAGAVFGFLGPNGAGKSTAIKMMTGIVAPDEGDAFFGAVSIRTEDVAVKRILGVVPDSLALFEHLSIWEHLDIVRSLFDVEEEEFKLRSGELLQLLDLAADSGKLARQASYGMRKKTALAMALLPNPKVLILDEPFEGLDPVMSVTVKRALKRAAAKGTTVFLSTHMLEAVEDLISHYGILSRGVLLAQGSMQELAGAGRTLQLEYLKHFDDSSHGELAWLG
jgi:ABC-2 type transport system ATP-binding protein